MGSNMTVKVPFFPVISKQLRILGSFRYGMGDYPLAISLVERGLIDLKPLVTQVVEFEEALEAFEHTRKGRDPNGKVGFCPRKPYGKSANLIARYQVYYQCSQVGSGNVLLPSKLSLVPVSMLVPPCIADCAQHIGSLPSIPR
jgi:hypothetical protein